MTDLPQPIVVTLSGAPATSPAPPEESAIHGAIHDSTGRPARLAYAHFAGGGDTYSDLNGNYRIEHGRSLGGIFWVWSADMREAAVIDVSKFDPTRDQDVNLQPAAQISGFIHDPSGQPVPNVNVTLSVKSGSSIMTLYMTTTGADGKYSINGILSPPAGTDVVICPMPVFDHGDHYNTTIAQKPIPADLTAGQKLDDFDFTVDLSQPLIHVTADPERH